jgi:hypothetical protein
LITSKNESNRPPTGSELYSGGPQTKTKRRRDESSKSTKKKGSDYSGKQSTTARKKVPARSQDTQRNMSGSRGGGSSSPFQISQKMATP